MAVQRTPYRALLIGGALLFMVYSAVWVLLLRDPKLEAVRAEDGPDAAGDPMIYYEVISENDAVHMMPVERDDPASVLLEAQKRFGTVKSLKRVSREAAERLQAGQSSSRLRRWFGLLLVFPVAVLLAGVWMRGRELRFERFWSALSPTLTADADKLAAETELGAGALRAALATANSRGLAQLEWDTECNRIADARLSLYNVTVDFCERCNEPLNQRVLADLKHVPRCPTCMFQHDSEHLHEMKRPIVDQLHQESAAARERDPEIQPFSPGTFGLLLLVFPPAAIAYAVRQR